MRYLFLVPIVLLACNQPVVNPTSDDHPCGTRAHMCGSGECCWNHEDCGGDEPGCPAGMCCTSETERIGARKLHEQFEAPQ